MNTAAQPRPLRADAERNRQRIVDAARELYAERGLDVSLDEVAAHAGVGVGTVYRRFANKEELIEGVFIDHLNASAERAREALENPDPWVGFVLGTESIGESIASNRGLAAVFSVVDHTSDRIKEAKGLVVDDAARIIQRAKDSGQLRADVEVTDMAPIFCMIGAVAEMTEAVEPGLWRRYLAMMLGAMRADNAHIALPTPPLRPEQLVTIKEQKNCGG